MLFLSPLSSSLKDYWNDSYSHTILGCVHIHSESVTVHTVQCSVQEEDGDDEQEVEHGQDGANV